MNGVKLFRLLTLSIPLFVIVNGCYYSWKHKQQQQEEEDEQEEEDDQEEEAVKLWSWAELDWNLLGEIVSRLGVTDQARFRAVCKDWLAAAHPIITTQSSPLPWHGCKYPPPNSSDDKNNNCSEFQIYDPSLSSPNNLASPHMIHYWPQLGIPSPKYEFYLHLVKHNWVCLSTSKPRLFFWRRRYVLLYSPFTKRVITLPTFDYPSRFQFVSTFSTLPDSPDCVFCMVDASRADKIALLTYHNGDKQWTPRQFNMHPRFHPWNLLPHIIGETLYILSPFGQVASYNILNGEFNFDRLLRDDFVFNNSSSRIVRSFELNGELMLLGFDPDDKIHATLPGQQFVTRYDRSLKVWLPVTNLWDYALFFSEKLKDVSPINTKDTTCNGLLSNKVYRFIHGGCLVYSLEDGKLVQFDSINSNLLEDGGDDLPVYKYNYATPTRLGYWLEAPRVRSSSDTKSRGT